MGPGNVRKRVVIVDDDDVYLRAMATQIGRGDMDVELFADPNKAIDHLDEHPADLVLIDQFMPNVTGVETCRQMRARAPWMTVIIVSGYVTKEMRWDAMRAGASRVLAKPVTPDRVLAAVVDAMRVAARARTLLVDAHLDLMQNIAGKLSRRYRALMPDDELEALAMLGLCEAAARFNPFREEPFVAFATWRIRGAILDGIRGRTTQTRRQHGRKRRISEARRRLSAGGANEASSELVADHLGLAVEDIENASAPNRITLQSMVEEPVAVVENGPDSLVEQAQIRAILSIARSQLPPLEAEIVTLHYEHGLSLSDIARRTGTSIGRVTQIRGRALAILRRAFAGPE